METENPDKTVQCVICLEDVTLGERAELPCCQSRTLTSEESKLSALTQYCKKCIHTMCHSSSTGDGRGLGIAKCPCCHTFIKSSQDGALIEEMKNMGTCALCQQTKVLVMGPLCDACHLGTVIRLRYECEGCGQYTRLPHPMWRYQTGGVDKFGNDSWFCHGRCQTHTHWRIHPDDGHLVPAWDAPPAWGREEEWRNQIRRLRQGGGTEEDRKRAMQRARADGDVTMFLYCILGVVCLVVVRVFWPDLIAGWGDIY